MARLARLAIENQLHYVGQQGHNGAPVILDAADAHTFLQSLRMEVFGKALQLHAFAIEPCGYHLLVTPGAPGVLSALVQGMGRRYGPYFNRRYQHRGGLWEGRFKTTVVSPDMQSQVMLWMAEKTQLASDALGLPAAQLGSAAHYQGQVIERCVTPSSWWWQMGNTPFARETAFVQALAQGLDEVLGKRLNAALGREWVLGDAAFIGTLNALTNRRIEKAKPGRPKKCLETLESHAAR